jgi:hypothetical protein
MIVVRVCKELYKDHRCKMPEEFIQPTLDPRSDEFREEFGRELDNVIKTRLPNDIKKKDL